MKEFVVAGVGRVFQGVSTPPDVRRVRLGIGVIGHYVLLEG